MSSKRRADTYLTDQNWDQEEDKQEAGKFESASHDILKTRTFKKAKRRIGATGSTASSAFQGFTGLTSNQAGVFKGFQLQTNLNSPVLQQFGLPTTTADAASVKVSNSPGQTKGNSSAKSSPKHEDDTNYDSKNPDLNRHLTALNQSVSRWIKEHVDKNPLCDLTPVFDDYLKHLNDIEDRYDRSSDDGHKDTSSDVSRSLQSSQTSLLTADDDVSSTSSSSMKKLDEKSVISSKSSRPKTPPKNPLGETIRSATRESPFKGFGLASYATAATSFSSKGTVDQSTSISSGFNSSKAPHQMTNEATTSTTGFKFASGSMLSKDVATSQEKADEATMTNFKFSFAAVGTKSANAATSSLEGNTDEEDYIPPKPESVIVQEEGTFYTKKCKLFYMKDGKYTDKGVGHLHLKSVPSSKKTQLIIRADTSLGHLLLNILLNPAMPITKQGKNNVVVSCIPNPPIDERNSDKVVPMLIRVKTPEDADQLLKILIEKKNETD